MSIRKMFIRSVESAGRCMGYEIVPAWRVESLPFVNHLKSLFAMYDVDCVFDVGANRGQYHDLLRSQVGYEGMILSFEPVRKYAEFLRTRANRESHWKIFDVALGSCPQVSRINVTTSPGLNSFLSPKEPGLVSGTELVRVETLDSILPELKVDHGFRMPYLKMDTQGYDLEVLAGARQSVRQFVALQTEASVKPGYDHMPSYQEALNTVRAEGFEISGMFPVFSDEALRLVEFDCVMVNGMIADAMLSRRKS